MKLLHQLTLASLLLTLTFGCGSAEGPPPKALGDWEVTSMEYGMAQQIAKDYFSNGVPSLKDLTPLRTWGLFEVFANLPVKDLAQLSKNPVQVQGRTWQTILAPYAKGAYLSFYADSTFSAFLYPHYLSGTWVPHGDTLKGRVTSASSICNEPAPTGGSLHLVYYQSDDLTANPAFLVQSKGLPTPWKLDTIWVEPAPLQATYREPRYNLWRHANLDPILRLKNHLSYLSWYFQDGLDRGETVLDPNAFQHCSPLRVFGNGMGLHQEDSPEVQCWKSLFANEEDFQLAHDALRTAIHDIRKTYRPNRENAFQGKQLLIQALLERL